MFSVGDDKNQTRQGVGNRMNSNACSGVLVLHTAALRDDSRLLSCVDVGHGEARDTGDSFARGIFSKIHYGFHLC